MTITQTFTRLDFLTFCGVVQLFLAIFGEKGWRSEVGVELKGGLDRGLPRFGVCGMELQSLLVWQAEISL